MQGCGEGAKGFSECRAGSAVEDSGYLGVGFNRHGCGELFDREGVEDDPELGDQFSGAMMA